MSKSVYDDATIGCLVVMCAAVTSGIIGLIIGMVVR